MSSLRNFPNIAVRLAAGFVSLFAARLSDAAEKTTFYERQLQQQHIGTDATGLAKYLRQLRPSKEQRRTAEQLVRQLGSADFFERQSAMRTLAALPFPPVEALKRAAAGNDPEMRSRAAKLLSAYRNQGTTVLYAVLMTISERKIAGLVPDIIRTIPLCEAHHLFRAANGALSASARKTDVQTLRDALGHNHTRVQAAAAGALASVLGDDARGDLKKLFGVPQREGIVVMAAARALANLGDRDALAPLVRLLSSNDVSVRTESVSVLRSSTGQNFGFASYAKPEVRAAVAGKWKAWLKANRETVKLHFPLKMFAAFRSYLNGNTLVAYGYKNQVVEYTPDWKEVWKYSVKGAFGAEKLPNGNVLIACYGPNEVIEVTPGKKVVWKLKVKSCLNARPLANGNILIAGHTSKKVLEVSRDKKTVWQFTSKNNCYDAHRLDSGNTLISTDKGVIEVAPGGKIVWEYSTNKSYYGIQPLPNGNILLANFSGGAAEEITRAKNVVWSHKVRSVFDVFRLPNGNTLITTSSKTLEVTRAGKLLWTRTGNTHGRTRR